MHNKEQKLKYIKSLKKYQQGDKIKQLRDKHPILDFLAGFIPGVGEAQDIHDFTHATKKKDYLGMGLSAAGLMLPAVSGGQIRKILSKLDWQKWADTTLGKLSTVNPRLTEGIVQNNPTAKAVERAYKEIQNGNIIIPEKRGVVDVNQNTFIVPLLHPHSAGMSPEAAIEAAIKFDKITPKGRVVPYIIGGNKGVSDVPNGLFIPGKATIKKGKKAGQFASAEDILTTLYYTGHGKQKGANAMYDYILSSPRTKQSKEYALERLATIEEILAKYSKNDEPYKKGLNKALGSSKKGREVAYNSDGTINMRSLGLIPEDLLNLKNNQAIKDYIKLEDSLYELSSWFGAENTHGMIQMFQKVPMNTYIGNFKGKSFNSSGTNLQLLGPTTMTASNADDAAMQLAAKKDPSLGIITDIVDGARPTTDIIFQPGNYSILEWKKGGRLSKSNFKFSKFKRSQLNSR